MFISTQIKKLQIFVSLAVISCLIFISCASGNSDSQLFPVEISSKIGYINNSGKLVIDAKFQGNGGAITNDFSLDGLAAVTSNGKCGYIDKTGKTVVDFRYKNCFDFSEGLALVVEDNKFSYIDKLGTPMIDFNKLDFELPPAIAIGSQPNNFSEGLTTFKMRGNASKVGFIDKSGKIIIPAQFDGASNFSEGFSFVLSTENGLSVIDKTGKIVINLRSINVRQASFFSEGLAPVKQGSKWSYIDTAGKIVIETQFDAAGKFSEGLAAVKVDKKWGYIGKSGNMVINPAFDSADSFSEGLARISINDQWGFIDKNGRMVIGLFAQGGVKPFSNGLARTGNEKGEHGYIDKSGNYVWKPSK